MTAEAVFSTGLLSSYCTTEDVLGLLGGYDLSPLGEAEVVAARVQQLLPITKQTLDSAVGHDFLWHSGETVVLDGNGRNRISLLETGRAPLVAVTGLVVNGRAIAPEGYVVYPQRAEVQLRPGGVLGGRFPTGQQNVVLTVDRGYPQVPAEATLAQAKLTAAQILAEAAGEKISAAEVRIGDYAVRYAAAGKYAAVIEGLVREAQALVRGYRRLGLRAV
jgi:hypothetical protein